MGVIIRNGIEYSGAGGIGGGGCDCGEIVYLTQAEYNALPESKLTNGVEYRITDSNPPVPTARDMAYDNSESGIEAETVQSAIDEVQNDVSLLNESLTASDNLKFQFATDGEGNYGYLGADDSFIPFKSDKLENLTLINYIEQGNVVYASISQTFESDYKKILAVVTVLKDTQLTFTYNGQIVNPNKIGEFISIAKNLCAVHILTISDIKVGDVIKLDTSYPTLQIYGLK